jgi:penicillin-binding protein 1A
MKRGRRGQFEEKARTPPRRPSLWIRILLWLLGLGIAGALVGAGGVAGLFLYYDRQSDLPRISSMQDYRPPLVTRIFDRNGVLIGEISAERRTVVPYHRIPKLLVRAVVAAEDAEFFDHRGLNYLGMLRAFLTNVRAGHFVQGGSSITQQVVKTFLLSPERTLRRKMQEVILARRLETQLPKEEILYLYLNQIYYGHGRYGVQEASRFFFGRDVDQIGLGEIALLAGLPQSPEKLSPFKHPQAAKRRQTYVLARMAKLSVISPADARRTIEAPIQVVRNRRPYMSAAPEYTDLVRAELIRTLGEGKLSTTGIEVHTALDVKLQLAAREAVQWGLHAIDAREGFRRPLAHLQGRRLTQTLARLARQQTRIDDGRRYQAVVTRVLDEAEELEVDLGATKGKVLLSDDTRYNPQRHIPSKRFVAGDLIRVRAEGDSFRFDGGPQAALVALDPGNGDVLALVGGYDLQPGDFNRVTQALRQPGSAFKPFIYAAALDSGKHTAASIIEDAPVTFGNWEPKNYDGLFRGPVRLRQALTFSINTVTARLLQGIGVEPVRRLATDMGITSPLVQDLSLALGTSEVRPLDLATAYATIASQGKRVEPQLILRLGHQTVNRPEPRQVLRPEVAFILTSLMQSVVQEGTARRAIRLGRPVAGKTGTTNDLKDAWFAGFTPQLVAVAWVGFDTPQSLGRSETGGQAALPVWVRFMQKALQGKPKIPFRPPPGVVVTRIDPETGLLAPEGASDVLEEYFIQGTEPQPPAPPTSNPAATATTGIVPATASPPREPPPAAPLPSKTQPQAPKPTGPSSVPTTSWLP